MLAYKLTKVTTSGRIMGFAINLKYVSNFVRMVKYAIVGGNCNPELYSCKLQIRGFRPQYIIILAGRRLDSVKLQFRHTIDLLYF